MTLNLAGFLGASLAPYLGHVARHAPCLGYVGYYLTAAGAISLLALLLIRRPQPQP